MANKQNIEKIAAWKKANVTRITIEVRNDSGIADRIAAAVEAGKAASRQAYIVAAVETALAGDGFPAEVSEGSEENA